ncbi:MAG: sugar phosphate isomerase/epimerase [Negativicutes bacterium]|nr:sugar phosphate isomerase/epimerase [Negativicutes bacterium]
MRICANTMIFLEDDAQIAMAKLAAMGFDAVDLFGDMPTLDYRSVDSYELKAIRSLGERYKIELSMHGPCWDLNPASASRGHRDDVVAHYKEGIRLAAAVGARTMVVHSGWRSDAKLSRTDALGYATETIARCLPEAKLTGVVLAVENVGLGGLNMFRSAHEWAGIAHQIGSPLIGLALDVGHAYLQGFDLVDSVHAAGQLLRHVNLHSNDGILDGHLRLDQGVVDIGPALKAMKHLDFQGHASIEIYATDHKEEALLFSRNIVQALLAA